MPILENDKDDMFGMLLLANGYKARRVAALFDIDSKSVEKLAGARLILPRKSTNSSARSEANTKGKRKRADSEGSEAVL